MKKQSFLRLIGMVALFFLTSNGFGQNSGGNSIKLDKNTMDAYTERVAGAVEFAEAADKLSAINKKMARRFTKSFSSAEGILISTGQDNFTYISCNVNGIRNRISYDEKGHWHNTLRFYGEETLPKDVRHQVKSYYYDFNIAGVVEVSFNGKLAHVLSLESKTEWKKLKVVDGEMEEMESFKKG